MAAETVLVDTNVLLTARVVTANLRDFAGFRDIISIVDLAEVE